MAGGAGDGVEGEALGGFAVSHVGVEVWRGMAGDAVAMADDVGDGFRFDFTLAMVHEAAIRDAEFLICAEMAEEEVTEFMSEGDEGGGGGVVAVEPELVSGVVFFSGGVSEATDEAGIVIALVIGPHGDVFLLQEFGEGGDAGGVDGSGGVEGEGVFGEVRAFGGIADDADGRRFLVLCSMLTGRPKS